jgi:hypothetical protein
MSNIKMIEFFKLVKRLPKGATIEDASKAIDSAYEWITSVGDDAAIKWYEKESDATYSLYEEDSFVYLNADWEDIVVAERAVFIGWES